MGLSVLPRRMFPFLSFTVAGLEPTSHYRMFVDVVLVDQHHWRYQSGKWVQCGKAEGSMPGTRPLGSCWYSFSPRLGAPWWIQEEPLSLCPKYLEFKSPSHPSIPCHPILSHFSFLFCLSSLFCSGLYSALSYTHISPCPALSGPLHPFRHPAQNKAPQHWGSGAGGLHAEEVNCPQETACTSTQIPPILEPTGCARKFHSEN